MLSGLLGCLAVPSFAQQPQDVPLRPAQLPFAIDSVKRLSDEDLAEKKEGVYFTGVPELSSDPVNGFGIGVEGELFSTGSKKDPLYYYTPYRTRTALTLFITNKLQREAALSFDVPYIFNSKWRLRLEAAAEINPNRLYFGQNSSSLGVLTNPFTRKTFSNYNSYESSLNNLRPAQNPGETGNVTDAAYNTYQIEEYIFNASAERSFMDGKARLLTGFEAAQVNITTFDGKADIADKDKTDGQSLLQQDYSGGIVKWGLGNNFLTIWQLGIVYDTRDLETDPGRGTFAEITNELSGPFIGSGSKYTFNKTFAQIKYFKKIMPGTFKKVVFAARVGAGYTAGDAPFFEYQDQWSSEGSIEGLGGLRTMRGYKQSRFLGRLMNFGNLELRCRFAEAKFLDQHFAFSAVPFVDAGGVWDNLKDYNSANYRVSEGMGLRIAWNVNTILLFDYAVSKEDNQFFFNLGHMF